MPKNPKPEPAPEPTSEQITPSPHDQVTDAVLGFLRSQMDGVALVSGWVVVAEFITAEDGEADLMAFATEGLPYWRINGMLDAAPLEMGYVEEDEELD